MKKVAIFVTGGVIGAISYFAFQKIMHPNSTNSLNKEISAEETKPFIPDKDNQKYSIIYVIRKDLKMKNGKISAQVGHASLGVFLKVQKQFPELSDVNFEKELFYCPNEEVQNQKKAFAKQNGLCTCLVHDAGRTQIEAGSATVLAIAPVGSDMINVFAEGLTPIPKK